MKALVTSGPVFWPNGIDPPTVADVLEAAYHLLRPSPVDFRSMSARALCRRCLLGTEASRVIFRSAEVHDRSPSFSLDWTPPDHLMGIPLKVDPLLPPDYVQFTDADGNVLHTIVLLTDDV